MPEEAPTPCAACAARERFTMVRDHGMNGRDPLLDLRPIEGDLFGCPDCGVRYRRSVQQATYLDIDDVYYFTRLDPPEPPPPKTIVLRCPECFSTKAREDESRSRLEFTYMQCDACGHGGLFDSWQRNMDWYGEAGAGPDRS